MPTATGDDGAHREFGGSLNARDTEVVRTIEEEGLSAFTFDGLRRITGVHPETLSRTLERLEDDGFLVRSPDGYATTKKAKDADMLSPAFVSGKRIPILHTFLPFGTDAVAVVSALKGRWFDKMRWVGTSESEEGLVLKWVIDDGSALIDARFTSNQLDVEAKVKDESDLSGAVRAAHQLVGRISRLYPGPRTRSRTMLMQIGYFAPYAM